MAYLRRCSNNKYEVMHYKILWQSLWVTKCVMHGNMQKAAYCWTSPVCSTDKALPSEAGYWHLILVITLKHKFSWNFKEAFLPKTTQSFILTTQPLSFIIFIIRNIIFSVLSPFQRYFEVLLGYALFAGCSSGIHTYEMPY